MKAFLLSAFVTVAFSWGSQFLSASAGEPAVATATVDTANGTAVFVVKVDGGDGQAPCEKAGSKDCLKVMASTDEDGVHVIRAIAGAPGASGAVWTGDPDGLTRVNLTAIREADVDENAGWLGVQLGSTKIEIDGKSDATDGIAILNVAKDSPAAAAGFERDDLLVEIDDIPVGNDLGAMVRQVSEAEAGERMKFTVVRDGARRTLVATLGRRADAKNVAWEFDSGVDVELLDELQSRVKVLREGKDGEWHFEIVDGDVGFALPENIDELIPGMHSRTMTFFGDGDGEHRVAIDIVRDGNGLSIESTDGGEIKVTRTDADSDDQTVSVYADADELAANDADAFEVFNGAGKNENVPFGGQMFSITLGTDDDDAQSVWVQELEANIARQSDALAEAMEQIKNIRVEVIADGDGSNAPVGDTFMRFLHRNKAMQTIRENPDGTIDVIVRKGENELVTRYADEADLESRNADAHATYLDLKSSGDE